MIMLEWKFKKLQPSMQENSSNEIHLHLWLNFHFSPLTWVPFYTQQKTQLHPSLLFFILKEQSVVTTRSWVCHCHKLIGNRPKTCLHCLISPGLSVRSLTWLPQRREISSPESIMLPGLTLSYDLERYSFTDALVWSILFGLHTRLYTRYLCLFSCHRFRLDVLNS